MAQATLSWPFGPIHLEDARGSAQDGHFVSIFAHPTPSVAARHLPLTGGVGPRTPITGVIPLAGWSISGAQNLSGRLRLIPAHWGLVWWKIRANAVPQPRLALPNQRFQSVFRRKGNPCGCPQAFPFRGRWLAEGQTDEGSGFVTLVGAAHVAARWRGFLPMQGGG